MSVSDCSTMETYCLERARLEPQNRGKWIWQAERWHELGYAQNSWRLQKRPLQQSMQTEPMATPTRLGFPEGHAGGVSCVFSGKP